MKKTVPQVTLFSETDIHGTILFANEAFCMVSKYSLDELLGKPHNIVRHRDMPQLLFKLLWDTIRKGDSFRGVIKNRAKDGSHYWVSATIMAIKDEDNKIVKYVGVRHLISDEKLAQDLYDTQAKSLIF
jgi:PAS domain S-box-containing protein